MASDVAFTFDDGPYTYTSDLLDKLKVYNAKATFFISKLESFQAFASLANNGKAGNNLGKGTNALQLPVRQCSLLSRSH